LIHTDYPYPESHKTIATRYLISENGEWINQYDLKNKTAYDLNKAAEELITLVKNQNRFFPIAINDPSSLILSIGDASFPFTSMLSNLTTSQILTFNTYQQAEKKLEKTQQIETILLAIHVNDNSEQEIDNTCLKLTHLIEKLPPHAKKGLIVFGSSEILKDEDILEAFDAVVLAYDNSSFSQNRGAQIISGAIPMKGKLKESLNSKLSKGFGISYPALNRLSFVNAKELDLPVEKLAAIDSFVETSIKEGVFPGCQVAFAYKGKVFYNKSFGKMTYEGTQKVKNDDIYDLASVTKVVSSTVSLMLLQSQGKINLDLKLSDYLPELVENSPTKNIVLRAMLSHQAGFTPFFPFYKKTIHNKQLDSTVYNSQKTAYFNQQVAANLYINNHYRDTMMAEILQTPLKTPGKYVYSDVGYYFVQRIIEKITGQTQDVFVQNAIYKQLGLNRTGYNPLTFYPLNKIAPTENDKLFRHQLIQGFVHDQGAAMQGGVAGHAGVFSNATDLLAIMQLFLNKGSYAGKQLIKKEVVEEYTKAQFPGNRRGIGFDRPTSSGENGPVTSKVSQQSFGHSGFTGTYVWADPQNELTYVFLSNRVYPDAENWKILSNKVRSTIHGMMYDIIATK
jgi:CubicO group peptidase (beta-lactamase class C family)